MFTPATVPPAFDRKTWRAGETGQASRKAERKAWRKTEAGRKSEYRRRGPKRDEKWLSREFVAWDGEGVSRDDGSHDYLILANSREESIRSIHHLTTEQILNFVLTRSVKGTINIIYGASYDWNMWLSDFTQDEMQTLYDNQEIRWHGYLIRWRRGKTFHIMKDGMSALFYDVVSFFQCSFVKACDSYLGDRFVDRDMIVQNKMLRSSFRESDLDEIATYNRAELINLVQLMTELRERLFRVGLKPGRWDGPGAIAVALLGRENIKDHMQQAPETVAPAIRSAYFGGRFEVVKCGHVERTAYEYDINSAYPWGLLDVPSLHGGTWVHHDGYMESAFAVYHVRYVGSTPTTFPQPLPSRYADGTVAFPQQVTGWYWGPEYLAARAYVDMYGGELEVIETWAFNPVTDVKPFAFVAKLFAERRILKAAGDGAHVGIKLGLNSLYGKLAQQVGWRISRTGELSIPPYHQLDWAGYVTAKCRAAVLTVALPHLDKVIAWETDAMFTEVPLDVETGSDLGQWEYTEFQDLTYLQSGMYFATTSDGEVVEKTRGVDRGEVTRDKVLDALRSGLSHLPAKLTRFMAIGIALQGRWQTWRRWETHAKNMALTPTDGKRGHIGCTECGPGFTLGGWHNTIIAPWAVDQHSVEYSVEWINPGMSELHALRQSHYEGGKYDD